MKIFQKRSVAVAVLILLGVYALNTYAACIAGGAA